MSIVAHSNLGIDYPSYVGARWANPALGYTAYVPATHSVVDWFAFGLWHGGTLVRALSVSPGNGIQEDLGDRLAFEVPFWEGRHPIIDDDDENPYPLPFHPLEFAEASLLEHLGFQFEGVVGEWVCDPMEIPIARFTLKPRRPFWKLW